MIQKLNAEGRLEKKESKKGGSMFDKVSFCTSYLVYLGIWVDLDVILVWYNKYYLGSFNNLLYIR